MCVSYFVYVRVRACVSMSECACRRLGSRRIESAAPIMKEKTVKYEILIISRERKGEGEGGGEEGWEKGCGWGCQNKKKEEREERREGWRRRVAGGC